MIFIDKQRAIKPDMGMLYSLQGLWRQHPLYRGCVGHWLFNEGGGIRAYDLSGAGNHGTLTNGPTWSTTGRFGRVLNFDGTNDFVEANTFAVGTDPFTISLWLNPDDFGTTYSPWGQDRSAVGNNQFRLDIFTTPELYFGISNSDNSDSVYFGAYSISALTWTHVAVTRLGNHHVLYINGAEFANADSTGTINWTGTVNQRIGARYAATGSGVNQPFDGRIDNVQTFTRALLSDEIKTLYHDPVLPFRWAAEQVRRSYFFVQAPVAGNTAAYYYRMMM